MHGYNSFYEDSENLNDFSPIPDKTIDVDGPWVYSALQEFLYEYYDKVEPNINYDTRELISSELSSFIINKINNSFDAESDYVISDNFVYKDNFRSINETLFVDNLLNSFVSKYCKMVDKSFHNQIIQQYYIYWHKIVSNSHFNDAIISSTIDTYQTDSFNNQFILFKSNTDKTYLDSVDTINPSDEIIGEIWIRLNNYPLAIPLTYNGDDTSFNYDIDVLTTDKNEKSEYLSILKEMTNHCIKFGVFQNSMWILRIH